MSAILERPIDTPQQALPQAKPRFKHSRGSVGVQPGPALRVRVLERSKPKTSVWAIAAARIGVFAFVMGATYCASSLAGHVLVESARQQRLSAIQRAADAKSAEAAVVRSIEAMSNPAAIERWAASRHFTAPDRVYESQNLLARR